MYDIHHAFLLHKHLFVVVLPLFQPDLQILSCIISICFHPDVLVLLVLPILSLLLQSCEQLLLFNILLLRIVIFFSNLFECLAGIHK